MHKSKIHSALFSRVLPERQISLKCNFPIEGDGGSVQGGCEWLCSSTVAPFTLYYLEIIAVRSPAELTSATIRMIGSD